MTTRLRPAAFIVLAALAACTGGGRRGTAGPPPPIGPYPPEPVPMTDPGVDPPIRNDLPPVPARQGALRIEVAYPGDNAALTSADSNFIFGNVGTGGATLTINGAAVDVAANGAFLGFLPVPRDGVYRLRASAGGQTAEMERRVRVPSAAALAASGINAGSISPRGTMTGYRGERVTVRFRGAPGARAQIRMPDGSTYPLAETRVMERAEGFMQDQAVAAREVSEYAGTFPITVPLRHAAEGATPPTLASLDAATGDCLVCDAVFNPPETALLRAARKRSRTRPRRASAPSARTRSSPASNAPPTAPTRSPHSAPTRLPSSAPPRSQA